MEYLINPIPKPRMTQRDKWLKPPRAKVQRYWDFCLQCKLEKVVLPCFGAHVTFILPMPKSWSKKKKKEYDGKPHMGSMGNPPQKEVDLDNLMKSLGDAIYGNDSGIYDICLTKRWGFLGKILIE